MLTLAIDAATYTGSVAVVEGDRVLAECGVAMRGERSERLMPSVAAALASAGVSTDAIGRVVSGSGPGSFTSLRIAASIAKGIAHARGCPLYAVPSLMLLVAAAPEARAAGRYLGILDAMRGDVFAACYEVMAGGVIVEVVPAALARRDVVGEIASSLHARPLGPNEAIVAIPRASGVARLAGWLDGLQPVDVATWEPDYGRLAEAQVRWETAHGRPLERR
jgi:tRNA threonylcarbamoyladenosine biosynthesis protein TsaB